MLSHMFPCSRLQHQVRLNRAHPVLMSLSSWARPLQEADGSMPKRQAAGSEKFLMKGIQVLTKLALKNAMDVRELQAASLFTVQLPKDNAFVVNMLKATKMFNDEQEKAKSSGGSPPDGQPHCHAWMALIDTLNGIGSASEKEILQRHAQEIGSTPATVACYIHVCRLKKCYDQTKMKLCLATCESIQPVLQIFENHVKQHGGKILHGQAPKGGLERDAQQFLDQLSDMLK